MIKNISLMFIFTLVIATTLFNPSHAEESNWQQSGIFQTYLELYSGPTTRELAFNGGVYVRSDYLDSSGFVFGYNYTFVGFEHNADLTEHLFYLSGRYHHFSDAFPGKFTLRLDGYFGEDTLQYNTNNPPGMTGGGGMGGKKGGSSSSVSESTNLIVYQPQLSFINFAKTFYADIGYAYSEYDGEITTKADQFTPTVGFGWNESYDWLQLRGYLIHIDESASSRSKDKYESLQIKYTHWFNDNSATSIENWQLTGLIGERLLAVDPDAAVVYSTADIQSASLSASIQWELSQSSKLLANLSFSQYKNALDKNYDSVLFYINLQRQW